MSDEDNKLNKLFPQEGNSNSMTTSTKIFSILWRPNNYRRQIEVKEKSNSGISALLTTIGIIPTDIRLNFNNHTKILSIKNYHPQITIQYAKNTLTAIYSQNIIAGNKEVYLFERYSLNELNLALEQKKQSIQEKLDNALNEFIDKANIRIMFNKAIWSRYEDWLKGIDFIDKISRETIIHDTFFKKVYPEGIEFIKNEKAAEPLVSLKNTIKNFAIKDISPEISQELAEVKQMVAEQIKLNISNQNALQSQIKPFNEALALYTEQINTHLKVENRQLLVQSATLKTLKAIRNSLEQKKMSDYI